MNPITPEKLAELRCSNWRATVAALDEEGYPREAQEWGHDLEEFMRQRYALPDLLDEIERLREENARLQKVVANQAREIILLAKKLYPALPEDAAREAAKGE